MSRPFDGMKVIGFDLETTGFDCRSERIVEYAMVGSDSDGKHISLCSLVDPEKKIPEQASSVHGITNSDVKGVGNFSDHSEKISEMMQRAEASSCCTSSQKRRTGTIGSPRRNITLVPSAPLSNDGPASFGHHGARAHRRWGLSVGRFPGDRQNSQTHRRRRRMPSPKGKRRRGKDSR